MFMGEYNHTVDEKGRLSIPSKFREELPNGFVITKGLDGCLFAFSKSEFEAYVQKITSLSFGKKDNRDFSRFLLGGAATVEFDKQGRVLIPGVLRSFAKIEKDVALVGVGNRFEIWNKDFWDNASLIPNVEELAERMEDLGM